MNGFFGMNGCHDGCKDDHRTGCGMGNDYIWLILLLLCSGCIDCNCLIWIILLSCCCGNGFGFGR